MLAVGFCKAAAIVPIEFRSKKINIWKSLGQGNSEALVAPYGLGQNELIAAIGKAVITNSTAHGTSFNIAAVTFVITYDQVESTPKSG